MKIGKVKAIFERDTKSFHRFNIDDKENGVTGTIYFPRDGEGIPDEITITLETKASGEK